MINGIQSVSSKQAVLSVSRIDTAEAFEALEPVWNRLLSQSDIDNIFLTYGWVHTWWEVFGENHELYILLVRSEEEPVGIAPLMLTTSSKYGTKHKLIRFIGTPNSDYNDFIGEDKSAITEEILKYLHRCKDEWTKIELSQIPQRSATLKALQDILGKSDASYRIKEIETVFSYVYDGNEADRRDFTIKPNRNLKAAMRFFRKTGGLTLERIRDEAGIEKLLPDFYHSHMMRWRQKGAPSKFLNPKLRDFHGALVKKLAPLNQICFMVLKHGGEPLAHLFAYDYNKAIYLYNIANGTFYQKRSPGIILFHLLIEMTMREGYDEVDFARGAGSHKGKFINRTSINYQVTIYDRRFECLLSRLYDRLKRTSSVEKFAQNKRLQDIKARMKSHYSAYGIRLLLLGAIKVILRVVVDYKAVLVFYREGKPISELSKKPGLSIEQLGPDNIETIAFFLGFASGSGEHRVVEERFNLGGECFIAKQDGVMAAMSWGVLRKGDIPDFDKTLVLEDSEVLLSKPFISLIYKDNGIDNHLITHMTNEYLKRNCRVIALCSNLDSDRQTFLRELAYSHISTIRYLKILGIRLH